MRYRNLDAEAIGRTIELLCQRVEERFPASGLGRVCRELDGIARRTAATVDWIRRPILPLRIGVGVFVALMLGALTVSLLTLRPRLETATLGNVVQLVESAVNDLVFVAVAIFSLVTIETRIKRHRALRAIHELRAIAHVIDMHQLTKDPEWVLYRGRESQLLPSRSMHPFELSRYLDYCSEALSLTGKVAALYIQDFQDSVALQAVNDVVALTTNLSRQIWQKLMIIYSTEREKRLGND